MACRRALFAGRGMEETTTAWPQAQNDMTLCSSSCVRPVVEPVRVTYHTNNQCLLHHLEGLSAIRPRC